MRGKASRAWLLAAVLACLVAGTDAIVSSVSQRIYARGGDARRFDRFGFKAGGTAQFATTFTEANNNNYDEAPLEVYIIGCPDTVMTDFQLKAGGASFCISQFAYSNSTVRSHCEVVEVEPGGPRVQTVTVQRRKMIEWAVAVCGEGTALVHMDYVLMNPGGEHLDFGHEQLPDLYLAFLIVWTVLCAWQMFQFGVIHAATITTLHKMMLIVPLFKMVACAIGMLKWETVSRIGYLPDWIGKAGVFADCFNNAATFGALLLIARGWLITRRHIPVSEFQSTVTSVVLLIVLTLTYKLYDLDNLSFFALAILYMTILALILSSVARNIRELKMQIMILRQADIEPEGTPAHEKAVMYRRLQLILFSFICTKIFLEMVLLFLRDYPWVGHLANVLVDMILCVSVSYTFRLRQPNPFNTDQGEFSWLPVDPSELGNLEAVAGRMAQLGIQIELPPPKIYEARVFKASAPGDDRTSPGGGTGESQALCRHDNEGCVEIPVRGRLAVVVENPPYVDADGVLTESISMAAKEDTRVTPSGGDGDGTDAPVVASVVETPGRGARGSREMEMVVVEQGPRVSTDLPGRPMR